MWFFSGLSLSNITILYSSGTANSPNIGAVAWSPTSDRIATLRFEGNPNLSIWDLLGRPRQLASVGSASTAQWSPSGRLFAVGHLRGSVAIHNTVDVDFERLFVLDSIHPEILLVSLDWSKDDAYLLGSDGYGRVFVWEVDNQKLVHTFHSAAVEDITVGDPYTHAALKARFSADGRSVQAVNADGTIRSWDLATGQLLSEVKVARPIVSAAWSPYGAQLVVDLLNPPQGDAQDALAANNLQILVPFASLEQFNAIASVCITNTAEQAALQAKADSESLAGLSAYVSGLPMEVIPPACAADLLAIAAALQGK
ncbi:MAG: hypothetical protein DYG88_04810 [Chloroflexi bacterium CFX4]|nr:hypothetical protein [Chloroflexi bacterium CFX4]MDL1924102.1 hypothetical protein [Chloroflexi bacterium CFX3]